MSEAAEQIRAGLAKLGQGYREQFGAAEGEQALRLARAELLGKKGELTQLLKLMGKVAADQRKQIGEQVNAFRAEVEGGFEGRLEELKLAARKADLETLPFDLTLPGRRPAPRGHLHPLTTVKDEILGIFESLGFSIAWGPEIELEENNFTKLAFPPDHPATDMQDTFWVDFPGAVERAPVLLRTHTSNVQVREMSRHSAPLAIISGGPVYRRDDDVTHSPMFHQIEGFLVDENVSFAHLKGVLTAFVERLYGPDLQIRFRPSYFPFVEPGAELDVECVFCTTATSSECRVCKGTRWLEVLGCGMVHPDVLGRCNIDSERYTGFAFGLGVERVAMLRYGIPDIRVLFENDPRFLCQF